MRSARSVRRARGTAALLTLAAALFALDVLTVFGSPMVSTYRPRWLGGYDLSLTGGCVWVRTGDGFMRTGTPEWNLPQRRVWWFRTNWYSISGQLNWRETYVPLWHAWAVLAVVAAARGPARAAWRRRRGVCEECGYPRAGLSPDSPCPECGDGAGGRG